MLVDSALCQTAVERNMMTLFDDNRSDELDTLATVKWLVTHGYTASSKTRLLRYTNLSTELRNYLMETYP